MKRERKHSQVHLIFFISDFEIPTRKVARTDQEVPTEQKESEAFRGLRSNQALVKARKASVNSNRWSDKM